MQLDPSVADDDLNQGFPGSPPKLNVFSQGKQTTGRNELIHSLGQSRCIIDLFL